MQPFACLPLGSYWSFWCGRQTPPQTLHIEGLREGRSQSIWMFRDGRQRSGLKGVQEQRLGSKQPV